MRPGDVFNAKQLNLSIWINSFAQAVHNRSWATERERDFHARDILQDQSADVFALRRRKVGQA